MINEIITWYWTPAILIILFVLLLIFNAGGLFWLLTNKEKKAKGN